MFLDVVRQGPYSIGYESLNGISMAQLLMNVGRAEVVNGLRHLAFEAQNLLETDIDDRELPEYAESIAWYYLSFKKYPEMDRVIEKFRKLRRSSSASVEHAKKFSSSINDSFNEFIRLQIYLEVSPYKLPVINPYSEDLLNRFRQGLLSPEEIARCQPALIEKTGLTGFIEALLITINRMPWVSSNRFCDYQITQARRMQLIDECEELKAKFTEHGKDAKKIERASDFRDNIFLAEAEVKNAWMKAVNGSRMPPHLAKLTEDAIQACGRATENNVCKVCGNLIKINCHS